MSDDELEQANVYKLKLWRDKKMALERERARIIQLYKHEIYDWCDDDLACKGVAQKSGLPERNVRRIIANAGPIFS
jgi:hypothetical protein